jgi:hypothetical protein
MSKERFLARLKGEFVPKLRGAGFTGSGQNFRRVQGEVIHALNIQGNKYGDSCAVNLGIHLTFFPAKSLQSVPDLKKFCEIDCEFRRRLAPNGQSDHWWKYECAPSSPEKNADSLIDTFFNIGETYFTAYNSTDAIGNSLKACLISEPTSTAARPIGGATLVRQFLAGARIYAHHGNAEQSRKFAVAGLASLGKAVGLREEFEAFLKD